MALWNIGSPVFSLYTTRASPSLAKRNHHSQVCFIPLHSFSSSPAALFVFSSAFSFDHRRFSRAPKLKPLMVGQKYTYPDPIPEFAEAETRKFRAELMKKLKKNGETFGDDCENVLTVCSEIFNDFLHKEYGGPGTFLVEPFTDMLLALKEKRLPGAPIAARAALLWAQNNVDRDWESWTSQNQRQPLITFSPTPILE